MLAIRPYARLDLAMRMILVSALCDQKSGLGQNDVPINSFNFNIIYYYN
jgi:hypothetical protein